jgi:hypothetical protein
LGFAILSTPVKGGLFMQLLPLRILALTIAVVLSVAGCASSTRIVNQWTSPDYTSPRFKKIMVIGVSKQASIRRTFEDEFVTKLKAAGIEAAPSYLHIAEDGQVDESRLQAAVKQAGADAVIITRLVRVDKKSEVSPGFYRPGPVGFYGGYSAAWFGYYEPPRVYQYDVYISETSLYDMNQLVWAGTAETTDTGDITKEIQGYVVAVIEALKNRNLLPSSKTGMT